MYNRCQFFINGHTDKVGGTNNRIVRRRSVGGGWVGG